MKIKTITVTDQPNNAGTLLLKQSMDKHNIDYEVIETTWIGFFTKINEAYKYCKETDADYILFVDAHDVVFVGGLDAIKHELEYYGYPDAIFSTEKAIWPPVEKLIKGYPDFDTPSPWKYLNSGGYLIRPGFLVELYESRPPFIGYDDQWYFSEHFLNNQENITLDQDCRIFQTLAHDNGSSFGVINGKFTNKVTGTNPVIVHGNGLSMQEFDYSYLNEL